MIKSTFIYLIRFYQMTASAVLGNRCRFYPSCSQYTIEAIQIHGAGKGVLLGLKRLSRCHPLCDGGIDFVPEHLVASNQIPENHDQKHKA